MTNRLGGVVAGFKQSLDDRSRCDTPNARIKKDGHFDIPDTAHSHRLYTLTRTQGL